MKTHAFFSRSALLSPAKKIILTLFFLLLTVLLLTYPAQCLEFSLTGLNLWFQKMIPTLLPFMILTGLMIRLNLTESFIRFLNPILSVFLPLTPNGMYTLVTGFLCGFPMGARVAADLYSQGGLSRREASLLLAFCNNIGPIYFVSFVLPTLGLSGTLPFIFGMYGIPFLYGMLLSRTVYRLPTSFGGHSRQPLPGYKGRAAVELRKAEFSSAPTFAEALDDAIVSGLVAIAKLGGYMIFFNLLNILPAVFCHASYSALGIVNCLLEITSGISRMGASIPAAVLILLPFGGFSCMAQTYSMIRHTDLSMRDYIVHKLALTFLTALYYTVLAFAEIF